MLHINNKGEFPDKAILRSLSITELYEMLFIIDEELKVRQQDKSKHLSILSDINHT